MNSAIDLAKEIYRKIKAREKTQSEHLKRDYAKSITRDYKELLYYISFFHRFLLTGKHSSGCFFLLWG